MKISFKLLKNTMFIFCIVFTAATLASCVINLIQGNITDTYFHILDRAILTLIGSIIVGVSINIDFKSSISNCLIPYLIFITLAFLYVFVSGFFVELHPNAYRDIFINDTIAYVIVYIGILTYKKITAHNT